MDGLSKRVLTMIQSGFPLVERPYAAIGVACGCTEDEAFACVRGLYDEGDIRRIGAVFDSAGLGYVSTLCALAVTDPADVERVAQVVDSHPEVTHDYLREDRYNLWFTVIARDVDRRQAVLDDIVARTGYTDLLDLPATRFFKIRVDFDLTAGDGADAAADRPSAPSAPYVRKPSAPMTLDEADRVLVRLLQVDLPRTMTPFDEVAQAATAQGLPVDAGQVLARVHGWLDAGIVRRFGAVVRHRRLGFSYNAMGVWGVPDSQVDLAGAIMAAEPRVSHCYARPRRPTWQANLYSMIHGTSREVCEECAASLHGRLVAAGVDVQPARLLYSTREFKKRSMRYFCEEDQKMSEKRDARGDAALDVDAGTGARRALDHSRSAADFAAACEVIPGGVNSPVRAFANVGASPVFYDHAEGSHVWDVDGNRYIDFIGSWGPMILGHRPAAVQEAVMRQLERGVSYGAPCEAEVRMAQTICELVPAAEKVRMTSSGTEATMSAIRLARGYTHRDRFIKFEGNYHGHSDALLVSAGSGVATFGIPGTPGVTAGAAADTLVVPYNDLDAVRSAFEAAPEEVACVIVEPIAGNMGVVPPAPGFLAGLRSLCDEFGALLIFDEVISGFRASLGGAQQLYGVTPDLCTFGKIIGGGFPVGCFAGRADIMDALAPVGQVYQAGTLSGNPVAMEAGLAMLGELRKPGVYEALEERGSRLEAGLRHAVETSGYPAQVNRVGSLATLFFTDRPVRCWTDAATCDTEAFSRYFGAMLERGFLIAPSQFEALFLSLAHTPEEIDAFTAAVAEVLRMMGENGI